MPMASGNIRLFFAVLVNGGIGDYVRHRFHDLGSGSGTNVSHTFTQHAGAKGVYQLANRNVRSPTRYFPGCVLRWWERAHVTLSRSLSRSVQRAWFSRATFKRHAIKRQVAQTAVGMHGILNMNKNMFFKNKSLLRVYGEAEWVVDRIPDEEYVYLLTSS